MNRSQKLVRKVLALEKLMRSPIKAKDAVKVLYTLIGDDELYDQIGESEAKDGPNMDVRALVAARLREFLKEWERKPQMFKDPWEPEAVEIGNRIVKRHG